MLRYDLGTLYFILCRRQSEAILQVFAMEDILFQVAYSLTLSDNRIFSEQSLLH